MLTNDSSSSEAELASLRQNLWRTKGEAIGDSRLCDTLPVDATDTVRWIDTDVMIADPLTKLMDPAKLIHVMRTGTYDIAQPIDRRQRPSQLFNFCAQLGNQHRPTATNKP